MRMREQSYLGWIVYLLQPSAKGARKISFKSWLESFGLLEKKTKEERVEDIEKMKQKSLEIAQKIVEMDKKKK